MKEAIAHIDRAIQEARAAQEEIPPGPNGSIVDDAIFDIEFSINTLMGCRARLKKLTEKEDHQGEH